MCTIVDKHTLRMALEAIKDNEEKCRVDCKPWPHCIYCGESLSYGVVYSSERESQYVGCGTCGYRVHFRRDLIVERSMGKHDYCSDCANKDHSRCDECYCAGPSEWSEL